MINYDKIMRAKSIYDYKFDWSGAISIETMIEDLQNMKNMGITHLDLNFVNTEHFEESAMPMIKWLETDEEQNARITALEKVRKDRQDKLNQGEI